MARVAAVIVTWNSESEIAACIEALRVFAPEETEIVVVDNASSDATVTRATRPGVRVIANAENRGFAAAANQGVRESSAPLILLLNPDAHLSTGLDGMISPFENPQVGAVGGMLTEADGRPQKGFMVRRFPSPAALIYEVLGINRLRPGNRVNWHYRCLELDPMVVSEVDQPAGAFAMFSREAWATVGGFDERFHPVWFEDVDFFQRVKEAGYVIFYTPEARADHTGAHSVGTLDFGRREQYWYGNLLEYAAKHYTPAALRVVCIAVAFGAGFRTLLNIPGRGLQAIVAYSTVLKLSADWFLRAGKETKMREI